jgi:hypothetical protein
MEADMIKTRFFYGAVFLLLISCAVSRKTVTAQFPDDTAERRSSSGSGVETVKPDTIREASEPNSMGPAESAGLIRILGVSPLGHQEARKDAITQLIFLLGETEITMVNVVESGRENGRQTKDEAVSYYAEAVDSILPQFAKIEYIDDAPLSHCRIYLHEKDVDKIRNIISVSRYIPEELIKEYSSLGSFYAKEILVVDTSLLTSGITGTIGRILEQEFFIRAIVANNAVYLYPGSRYGDRIIDFLGGLFGKIERFGNEIRVGRPSPNILSWNPDENYNIRLIKVNTNHPVPELNAIMLRNGLSPVNASAKNRFSCNVRFSENKGNYGLGYHVVIEFIDNRDMSLLLSKTLVSLNYSHYNNSDMILENIKEELAAYISHILPTLLENY